MPLRPRGSSPTLTRDERTKHVSRITALVLGHRHYRRQTSLCCGARGTRTSPRRSTTVPTGQPAAR